LLNFLYEWICSLSEMFLTTYTHPPNKTVRRSACGGTAAQ
jgi:hypothetical protein